MKHLWELWPTALSERQCDDIVKRAYQVAPVSATVGFDSSNRTDTEYRSSTIRWLDTYGEHPYIADMIMHYVRLSNRNNFGFDIGRMNELQFTEYDASKNGKYDWHHDVDFNNPAPYDRKLSVVVQLSYGDRYQGGNFEFFGIESPGEAFRNRGSILIFPSFFMHRVLPVIESTRTTLVTWIDGPKWK